MIRLKQATAAAKKPLVGWDKTYAEAEKLLPAVQKLKDPAAVAAAKGLKESMTKADKALTTLHGNVDMADKIASKADKEDAAVEKSLDTVMKAATDSSNELGAFVIGFPGQLDLLWSNQEKIKAGKLAAAALKNSIPVVQKDMKEYGAQITTATSVHSSMGPIIKKAEGAYVASVREDAKKAAALEKKLGEQIPKARTLLNTGLKDVKELQDYLAKLG